MHDLHLVIMDQTSELGGNDEVLESHGRNRGSGWFSGGRNPVLFDPHVIRLFDPACQSSNSHLHSPETTRYILLDSSESDSERNELAAGTSLNRNDRDHLTFAQNQISPMIPDRSSKSESVQFRSRLTGDSSFSNPDSENNLRLDPSRHPGMVRSISHVSESSKSECIAVPSGCWKNTVPSEFLKPHTVDFARKVMITSSADSMDSIGNNIIDALPSPKSRFTFKTASNTSCATEKCMHSSSVVDNSEIKGCSKRMVPCQLMTTPSGSLIMDHSISGKYEDGAVFRKHTLCTNVKPVCSTTLNTRAISSSQNLGCQQAFPYLIFNATSELVTSKFKSVLPGSQEIELGDPIKVPSLISAQSVQVFNKKKSYVASSSCKNTGMQTSVLQEATKTKSNCTESIPRSIESSQGRSPMSQNLSSPCMAASGLAPDLGFSDIGPVGSMCPLTNALTVRHQTSNLRPEAIELDCLVSGRSGIRSSNSRSIASSSLTRFAGQTCDSVSGVHSNRSYLGNCVDFSAEDWSKSPSIFPSKQSCVNTSVSNSGLPHQEQHSSSKSPDAGIVFMSLVYKKNKVAASSYNSSTGQVHLLESVTEMFELSLTVLVLRSVLPSIVFLPSSGASRFSKELKAKIEGDQALNDCQFQCLPPRCFAYGFARRTVLESSLWEGCLTFHSEDAKKNAILSNINLNDERLVCAFGGLLHHLSTECPLMLAGMSHQPITSVQLMNLSNKLWIDTESFKNLQIFDPAEHPSSFKWSSTNKDDGNSIFGLFERFCSPVGMTKLKFLLANPVNCSRILKTRHEAMDFFLKPGNMNAVESLRSFASQMSSSSVILGYLSSPSLRGGHWKHIYRHIYYTVSYAEVCRSHSDQSELFRELGSMIVDAVYSMAHNLERVVDLVNMENNETFVIKYGFHPPLDAAKEKFSRLKVAMDKVTPYEFDSVPSFIRRIQMMYIPEMKFLLSIPYWASDLSKEELILPNLEFKFTANKTAFYKSRRCYELDELLGDAQTDIINEESIIIQSLKNFLKKHMHHIVGMAEKIAEIECIFALAKAAREERYTKPEIVDRCVIDIRGGWHPLLGIPSNEIISNDMVSSADTSLVKLIYGPNASGKSIYLKQVGLIMYLVHVGSYVPALSARVGLFGRFLARTTMEESVVSMSSTMLHELKKLQDAVMVCAKDSLVILDEVGKGSTEINSIGIVTSAINYFLSQGSDCPHVLISTHLSGISDFVTSPPHSIEGGNLFELLIMNYVVSKGDIVFLYKIRQGSCGGCFMFEVLGNSEFPATIVKTARTVLEALRTGDSFLPYGETRVQRSHKFLNFIRKFVNIDMAKPGYLEKLQNKIQRYYEKPPF